MTRNASRAPGRRLSRVRLRLAGVFALTFGVALATVAALSLGWLLRESTQRLDDRLMALTASVARGIRLEKREYPDSGLRAVANDVQREWVVGPDSWLVLAANDSVVASTADSAHLQRVLRRRPTATRLTAPADLIQEDDDLRMVIRHEAAADGLPAFTLVGLGSTEGIERDTELLLLALAIATPLIALLSLASGYLLSRWALRPADALGRAIDALGPAAPSARLPITEPADEIDELAARFNALLDRLAASQAQNRNFVREAAHQIRTPLTLVRGEAEYALQAATTDAGVLQATLGRIERASRQMQRRVDELLLLAEAEAGARLEQRLPVELDTLVVDGVDLFRARAAQLDRSLAYGTLEPASVLGDEALLREALLELLENACRHGRAGTPITVSVRRSAGWVELRVDSRRPSTENNPSLRSTGLGQRIVTWIAEAHDGRFMIRHEVTEDYAAVLTLPETSNSP